MHPGLLLLLLAKQSRAKSGAVMGPFRTAQLEAGKSYRFRASITRTPQLDASTLALAVQSLGLSDVTVEVKARQLWVEFTRSAPESLTLPLLVDLPIELGGVKVVMAYVWAREAGLP